MKKVLSLLTGVLLFGAVNAQTSTSEIEMYQSMFNMEKKAMIAEFMDLNDEQSTLFWDIYNAYEAERSELGKQRIELLNNYADQYETMNDESAATLLADAMKQQSSRLKVRDKYTKKVKKALGAKKAAQFYQFENYIDRAIAMYITNNIPFVGEMN